MKEEHAGEVKGVAREGGEIGGGNQVKHGRRRALQRSSATHYRVIPFGCRNKSAENTSDLVDVAYYQKLSKSNLPVSSTPPYGPSYGLSYGPPYETMACRAVVYNIETRNVSTKSR